MNEEQPIKFEANSKFSRLDSAIKLGNRVNAWRLAPFLIAGVVLTPIIVVTFSIFTPADDVWRHLVETTLLSLLINTFWLCFGVVMGAVILGTSLA